MYFSVTRKFIAFVILGLITSCAFAKVNDKKALTTTVSQALQYSDQEAFHVLINPLVQAFNTTSLGLSPQESMDFKNKLTSDLSNYMADILFELRMATFSEAELQAMAKHYTSPMGKRIAKKLPLIRELQNVESLNIASSQILTKAELDYAKTFASSEIGQAIATKTKQVNETLLTKVNAGNALLNKANEFSKQYLEEKGIKKIK
jgi:hypothetical protein